MNWDYYIKEYKTYLRLERGLSDATVKAYLQDVNKLISYLGMVSPKAPTDIKAQDILDLLGYLVGFGISHASQSRVISGLKSFFDFLEEDEDIAVNPMAKIETPKLAKKLPDTLDYHEIEHILSQIDISDPLGFRNRSILETLYSSGLRVSELVNLKWSNVNLEQKFMKVLGKGNKERLVPIGSDARKYMDIYFNEIRVHLLPKKGDEDIVYLNRRGGKLTREMVFHVVKNTAKQADINKKVSPHTYRHSFATHLVEGGADLRAVQEMLGHESITTTEIYTHLDKEYLMQTVTDYHPRS